MKLFDMFLLSIHGSNENNVCLVVKKKILTIFWTNQGKTIFFKKNCVADPQEDFPKINNMLETLNVLPFMVKTNELNLLLLSN
jgi:hypothetical protein